jgi:iron complex transport system substrate-binding protein
VSALDKVRQAAIGKDDIKVLLVSRSVDSFYAADPKNFPEIQTLEEAGVEFVDVAADPASGGFFEELSWEQAGKYEADVILYDAREAPDVAAKVSNIETWSRLPAVRAGQVYEWKTAAPYSYEQYAPIFEDVARWLDDVQTVR